LSRNDNFSGRLCASAELSWKDALEVLDVSPPGAVKQTAALRGLSKEDEAAGVEMNGRRGWQNQGGIMIEGQKAGLGDEWGMRKYRKKKTK
jgi:hypothetical protein